VGAQVRKVKKQEVLATPEVTRTTGTQVNVLTTDAETVNLDHVGDGSGCRP
jgi:hypothetical protein